MSDNQRTTPIAEDEAMKWVIANILAIIFLLQEKFGPMAVEQIVSVATEIENDMNDKDTVEDSE